jgi:hypothetical protein
MAHFAEIVDGYVTQVIVVSNDDILDADGSESETIGQEFIASIGLNGTWLQCSYSGSFRGAYPGSGWAYDAELDVFVLPQAPTEEVAE